MEESGRHYLNQILNNWHTPSNILKRELSITSVGLWCQMSNQSLIMRKYRQIQLEGQIAKWLACHLPKCRGQEVTETLKNCSRLQQSGDLTAELKRHPWLGPLVKEREQDKLAEPDGVIGQVNAAPRTTQIASSQVQMLKIQSLRGNE